MAGRTKDHPPPPAPEPLPYPVIDNHCHLDTSMEYGGPSVPEALAAAAAVGVPRIVQVGCDLVSSRFSVQVAEEYEQVVAAVALHPNDAPRYADGQRPETLSEALAEIEQLADSSDRVRAIGETGLDYFRTGAEGRDAQHESFRAHIDIAKRLNKTLMIHDREAHDDVLAILDEVGMPDRVVMHCFSGDADFARECLDRGAWLSFSGTVTFKSSHHLREALNLAPLGKILVETDAPFLTPEPFRGRRNAPYLVPHTVRFIAETTGQNLDSLCKTIENNTFQAFGGVW